jgi:hypothetical protein
MLGGTVTMARVYLDPSAVLLEERGLGSHEPQAVPGATKALRDLADAVDEVVVLSADQVPGLELPEAVHVAHELPSTLGSDTWFVTADPESIRGRSDTARTVLVGPKRAPGPLPLPRVDVEARDLAAAVIEILTRQAMR